MRALKFAGILVLGIALGAGAGAALWYAPNSPLPAASASIVRTTPLTGAPAPVVDSPAPDFSLRDLEGNPAALADMRGTAVILNFWATWCDPCREELPLLDRIARNYGGSLTVIAVETGEPIDEVRSFAKSLGLASIRVVPDPAGQLRDLYLVRGFPTTFFIDSAGIVRRIKIGTLESAEIESILSQMGVTP
jgi:cytochrome c biogenesis protein CcmG/thiol:disulfide interchange protein DsbE